MSTAGEEVRDPKRALPRAIIGALIIVVTIYVLVALAGVGSQPLEEFSSDEQQSAGLSVILENITGTAVPGTILAAGAVISIFSVTLVTLYGQTRILFAMGRDRMLPDKFAEVNPRTLTPTFNTIVVGVVVALIAGFVPSDYLWDTVSIGTLVAFSVVAIGVLVLRRTQPDLERPFKVPGYPVTPILTVAACVYVLSGLAAITWVIFGVWLARRPGVLLPVGPAALAAQRAGGRDAKTSEMTLIVGFQPGKDERSGIELAATLARSLGQDLLSLTVVPAPWPTPVAGHTDREFEAWSEQQGAIGVTEAEALLAEHCPDVPAVARWAPGRSVPGALLDQAEEIDAAMIVIGAGSAGSYGYVHLGATGNRLVHSSRIPVAIATRGYSAGDHRRVRRATCAFRGDEVSRRTLERTATICAEIGASLRVATFAVRGRTMYPPEVGTHAEDMVLERWVEQATTAQEEAVAGLERSGLVSAEVETVVATGRTWATTIDRLPWDRDDVLVIGSSASAGVVERIFLGSNASKILRHSPVPVVAVP